MRSRPSVTVFGVSLAVLVALSCLLANAQSGRRHAKPPAAVPVPSPTPKPTPAPTPERDENEVGFLVASGDRGTSVSRAPFTFHEAARDGCADQLRKRTSRVVDVSRRDMSRGDAIEKAKSGKTTYVVLITLIEDEIYARSRSDEFEVDYVVFAPGTAKVMASGRTYESSARKGPISVGRPGNINLPIYREQVLRSAGAYAADRILKSVHLTDPPPGK